MATRYSENDYDRDRYSRRYDERSSRDADRGFVDRAGDEVRSWFGDEEAERRRRIDERLDERRRREVGYVRSWTGRNGSPRASDLMTRNVATVHPSESIERAARLMRDCDCGAIPVVDSEGHLLGMVTDRDIAVRIVGRGLDPRRCRIDDCMTDTAFSCGPDDSTDECLREMSRHQVRRLPIVDGRNRVIGIVSQSDLARHAGTNPGHGERRAFSDTICAVSEPTHRPYR